MAERRRRSELRREMWEIEFTSVEDCRRFVTQLWEDEVIFYGGNEMTVRVDRNDFEQMPQSSQDIYNRSVNAGVVIRQAGPAPSGGPNSRRRMPTPEEASELHRQFAERRQLRREGRP